MSLFLLESTSPPPSVCLSTSGAQSHLHCRQTQVGSSSILLQSTVVSLISSLKSLCNRHQSCTGWHYCAVLICCEKIESKEFEWCDRETSSRQTVWGKEDPDRVWEEGMLLCYTVAWGTIASSLENCHGCQIEGVRLQSMTPDLTRVCSDVSTPTQPT